MFSKFRSLFAPHDLTVGSPLKGIALFSLPLLIGNIAQQLYNTVDAIVVGNYVGDAALGAVGIAGTIMNLILVLFIGISMGATIVVSQLFGARERDKLGHAVGTTITITILAGAVMTVIGLLITKPLLVLLGTSDAMMDYADKYLKIVIAGLISSGLYNILSGVMRGMGDSVSPLLYLLIASVLNVILDLVFVICTPMDTDGVALATILAQAVSALLCIRRLFHMQQAFDLDRSKLKPDRAITGRVVRLGVPAGLTQMLFSLSAILVQGLINSMGDITVTANNIVMRVDGFAMMPNFTFGTAATTYTGQNVGAKKADRLKQGTKYTLFLAVGTATLIVACILLFGPWLMGIFTHTEEIIGLGTHFLRVLSVGYILFGITQVLHGVMRGAGETFLPMVLSIIGTLAIRMPLAYLLAGLTKSPANSAGDPLTVPWSALISWIVCCALSVVIYLKGRWKRHLPWLSDDPRLFSEGGN